MLADMHNAANLKAKCINFITMNSVEVRKSDAWKRMIKERPELLIELYMDISDKTNAFLQSD